MIEVEFSTRRQTLHPERTKWPQVMFLGAHTDDDAMFRLTNKLAEQKIGVTIATLTNSDARNISGFTHEQLAGERWKEAITSGVIGGVAEVRRLEVYDGLLHKYPRSGIAFAGEIIDEIQPIALVTLHPEDQHSDHRTAYDVGVAVAGNKTPLYTTDTVNGRDRKDHPLQPQLYIPLTEEIEEIERQTYLANRTQVTNLPSDEMVDVENVLSMTQRRGKESDTPLAAVLFKTGNTLENPIEEILLYSNVT